MQTLESLYPYCSRDIRLDLDALVEGSLNSTERGRVAASVLDRLEKESSVFDTLTRAAGTLGIGAGLRDRVVALASEHKRHLADLVQMVSALGLAEEDREARELGQIGEDLRAAETALGEAAGAESAITNSPGPKALQ